MELMVDLVLLHVFREREERKGIGPGDGGWKWDVADGGGEK